MSKLLRAHKEDVVVLKIMNIYTNLFILSWHPFHHPLTRILLGISRDRNCGTLVMKQTLPEIHITQRSLPESVRNQSPEK